MDDEMIMHYGVKGMKWGVRKARSNAKKKKKTLKNMRELKCIMEKGLGREEN